MSKNARACRLFTTVLLAAILARAGAEPVYQVISDTYTITGRTRQSVIKAIIGPAEGREFASVEEINSFTTLRQKKLDNLRSFKSSSVSASFGTEEAGVVPVSLETAITDGTAFVPIPYLFYNSNEGFMAGLVANAPNVLGTLQNLTAMDCMPRPPDDRDRLQWTDPNFMLVVNWSNIRLDPAIFQITAMAMRMNRKIEDLGILRNKFHAIAFTGIVSAEIPVTGILSSKTTLKYSWSPDHTIDYITDESLLPWGPIDSVLGAETGFVINSFHWEKNFRSGWKAEALGGIEYTRPSLAADHTSYTGEAELAGFYLATQRFNPQARISAFGRTGNPVLDVGRKIRGIRNGELRGNAGVFLNTGVQIFLARIGPVELHLVPCFDAVWLYTDNAETRQNDWGLAAGGEFLVFLDALKSLPIKFGAGYDLRSEDKNGSDKFYEIDFSFALTY